MNDLILFMAGGIWVFVMACLFAFIEHLKNKLNEKNSTSVMNQQTSDKND